MNENSKKRSFSLIEYSKVGAESVLKTFYRFPLTIIMFFALAVLLIYQVETPYNEEIYDILNRLTSVVLLGITLSLAVEVLIERYIKNNNFIIKIGSYILEILLLVLYYIFLYKSMDFVSTERLVLFIIALLLSFLFIPYLFKKEGFEIYITKIITRVVVTGFFAVVLGLGLSATIFAIKSLLYDGLKSEYYAYAWIFTGCIFASIYFLSGVSKKAESFSLDSYNKVIQVLLLYIIMPLLGVYTAVLYVYFAKILITQVWPEGIVSYLVLSYTAVGIGSIFLIAPFKNENKWVKTFISLSTKLIFPLLAMMFVSIAIRIQEYGFTENRYFIVVIGIWATFAMGFIIFNKCKDNIVLPISLAIVAFLSVVGPWSAFNVSIASQTERFNGILSKYDMIQNEQVINNNASLERIDKKEVVGVLQYFDRYHQLEDLIYLPDDFRLDKMIELFGFDQSAWYNDFYENNYINYYKMGSKMLVISEYDIHFLFRSYEFINEQAGQEFNFDNNIFKINVSDKYIMTISRDDQIIYQLDIGDYVQTVHDKYGLTNTKDSGESEESLILINENDQVKVMIEFNQIYGSIDNSAEKIVIENIEADIYIGIK